MIALLILDQWWWLMIPGLLLGIYAQFKVQSTYARYLRVPSSTGITGAQAARDILDQAGLQKVGINEIPGALTDHYDPTKRALFLSSDNFHGTSLSALGVSAHEAGHALQHAAAYSMMTFRQTMAPVAGIATNAAMWITFLGYMGGMSLFRTLLPFTIAVFAIVAVFQLVTLPVEFDASRRARAQLLKLGLITNREEQGVGQVLNAAGLTYVAAMVSSVMTLLHLVLMARGDDRD